MILEGSCTCGAVRFRVRSRHPHPYQRCYCSICRKSAGTGGYAINLRADADTLVVEGEARVGRFHARIEDPGCAPRTSEAERAYCTACGTALWLRDPRWPDLLHPHASAVDTPLPIPPALTHIMLDFKPDWVPLHAGPEDKLFGRYPDESIAEWHERHGVVDET